MRGGMRHVLRRGRRLTSLLDNLFYFEVMVGRLQCFNILLFFLRAEYNLPGLLILLEFFDPHLNELMDAVFDLELPF